MHGLAWRASQEVVISASFAYCRPKLKTKAEAWSIEKYLRLLLHRFGVSASSVETQSESAKAIARTALLATPNNLRARPATGTARGLPATLYDLCALLPPKAKEACARRRLLFDCRAMHTFCVKARSLSARLVAANTTPVRGVYCACVLSQAHRLPSSSGLFFLPPNSA